MVYYVIKVLLSAIIIVMVAEISKSSTFWGSVLASLPLVSILAFLWLYIDTKNSEKIAELSINIFWLVIPSLSLFLFFTSSIKENSLLSCIGFVNGNNGWILFSDGFFIRKAWDQYVKSRF